MLMGLEIGEAILVPRTKVSADGLRGQGSLLTLASSQAGHLCRTCADSSTATRGRRRSPWRLTPNSPLREPTGSWRSRSAMTMSPFRQRIEVEPWRSAMLPEH
jgi:hypothetical protein